jgi:hypothetical protein
VLQNDLVHGWGLDFALRKCVEVSRYLINLSNFYLLNFLYVLKQLVQVLLLCCVAGPWEDRSCWFSVDYSPKYSLTRESGDLFTMIVLVSLYNLQSIANPRCLFAFMCFGRETQNLGNHHGKGYVVMHISYSSAWHPNLFFSNLLSPPTDILLACLLACFFSDFLILLINQEAAL